MGVTASDTWPLPRSCSWPLHPFRARALSSALRAQARVGSLPSSPTRSTSVSQFGSGELEIRVAKPLTLLTAFPRFLGKGDGASFDAVVTNGGKDAGTAVVTVQSLDQATLQFSAVRQEVRLAPGASQSIKFDAVAMAAGEARVRITARLGGETDALEMPLTIGRPMRPETAAA